MWGFKMMKMGLSSKKDDLDFEGSKLLSRELNRV